MTGNDPNEKTLLEYIEELKPQFKDYEWFYDLTINVDDAGRRLMFSVDKNLFKETEHYKLIPNTYKDAYTLILMRPVPVKLPAFVAGDLTPVATESAS